MANTTQTFTTRFSALGTTIEGGIRADAKAAKMIFGQIKRRVQSFEANFSRFKAHSELSLLNANAGQSVTVSTELMALLSAARDMWLMTEGIIDPTIGQALISAGYDRSFDRLEIQSNRKVQKMPEQKRTLADVALDEQNRTVVMPPGTVIDLGGIGKGYLLDQLASSLGKISGDFWWSLGGDMVVSGTDEDGRSWSVGVQDPNNLKNDTYTLRPPVGMWGIATSGTAKRRGVHNGQQWHHIIDPRTGRPASTGIVSVTVVAPRALEADVAAKAIVILGETSGQAWLQRHHNFEALIIKSDGTTVTSKHMKGWVKKI